MQQIADWLEKLGMSEYADRFAENDIDFAVLPDLTDQDLEKIGVAVSRASPQAAACRTPPSHGDVLGPCGFNGALSPNGP